MNKITFCIPSKNNLRYLKNSITSIRKNSSQEHDIIVYIDADNDGTEQWLKENNIDFIKNETNTPKGIATGYNECIKKAKTDVVCMFHADMYMGKGFDIGLFKYLQPKSVVSATRIEPPLHPEGKEKIVKSFGMYPEDFLEDEFNNYVENIIQENQNKTTKGIFAPWVCYKEDIMEIGLHDEYFHSYHEDSDIFNRFIINGYEIIQSWESYVYHLTCRGGQFQDGVEQITKDPLFHEMKTKAARNYVRKWGSFVKNNEYQYPIIPPKYNIAFVVENCSLPILEALEPWCDRIYTDEVYTVGRMWDYIENEQQNTKFDLRKRVFVTKHNDPKGENDIIISFNASKLTNQSFQLLTQLPEIIKDSGEVGTFNLDIFTIDIIHMNEYQNNLIKI